MLTALKNKDLAININKMLVEIEAIDHAEFLELYEFTVLKLQKLQKLKNAVPPTTCKILKFKQ